MGAPADLAIQAVHVSKRFRSARSATSLKERLLGRAASSKGSEDFWALRDVNVEIPRGGTIGLIGANGSGKSTLLKVLAGILLPNDGQVTVNGRISSLLELGAGFNGELSGRDNVYLNASLLGLSHKQTEELFPAILEFSELEDFIDDPVKHYSSGMYVRLGFAVAVHVDPDILLVDEVLAVGDEAFARKCLDKIEEFQQQGRTILFVSHALDLVERICDRAIVLHHGEVVYDGDPEWATGTLRGLLGVESPRGGEVSGPGLEFEAIRYSSSPGGPAREVYAGGEPLTMRVTVTVDADSAARADELTLVVMGAGGIPIWVMKADRDSGLPATAGRWEVDFVLPELPPLLGRFVVAASLAESGENGAVIAAHTFADGFNVKGGGQESGLLRVPYELAVEAAAVSITDTD
jgi:ABC-2 type transport system ATP-binding protein